MLWTTKFFRTFALMEMVNGEKLFWEDSQLHNKFKLAMKTLLSEWISHEVGSLWTIEISRFFLWACLMKFNWKFKFQGLPLSLLHHRTAFVESDSRIKLAFFVNSFNREILIGLCIASISALLISNKRNKGWEYAHEIP